MCQFELLFPYRIVELFGDICSKYELVVGKSEESMSELVQVLISCVIRVPNFENNFENNS